MNIFDSIVHAIWWDTANKHEDVQCSTRNRVCGGIHVFGMLGAMLVFTILGFAHQVTVTGIVVWFGILMLFSIPRFFITAPPEVAIRQDWLQRKNQEQIKVKFLDSGETANMLYNTLYNQGVLYTEEGMKVVDLPLHNYNKTWVAFDSDLE